MFHRSRLTSKMQKEDTLDKNLSKKEPGLSLYTEEEIEGISTTSSFKKSDAVATGQVSEVSSTSEDNYQLVSTSSKSIFMDLYEEDIVDSGSKNVKDVKNNTSVTGDLMDVKKFKPGLLLLGEYADSGNDTEEETLNSLRATNKHDESKKTEETSSNKNSSTESAPSKALNYENETSWKSVEPDVIDASSEMPLTLNKVSSPIVEKMEGDGDFDVHALLDDSLAKFKRSVSKEEGQISAESESSDSDRSPGSKKDSRKQKDTKRDKSKKKDKKKKKKKRKKQKHLGEKKELEVTEGVEKKERKIVRSRSRESLEKRKSLKQSRSRSRERDSRRRRRSRSRSQDKGRRQLKVNEGAMKERSRRSRSRSTSRRHFATNRKKDLKSRSRSPKRSVSPSDRRRESRDKRSSTSRGRRNSPSSRKRKVSRSRSPRKRKDGTPERKKSRSPRKRSRSPVKRRKTSPERSPIQRLSARKARSPNRRERKESHSSPRKSSHRASSASESLESGDFTNIPISKINKPNELVLHNKEPVQKSPTIVEKEKEYSVPPMEKEKKESSVPPMEKEKEESSVPPMEKEKKKSSVPPMEKEKEKEESSVPPMAKEKKESSVPPMEKEKEYSVPPMEKEKKKSSVPPMEKEKEESSVPPMAKEKKESSVPPMEKEKKKESSVPPVEKESSVPPMEKEESSVPPMEKEKEESSVPPKSTGLEYSPSYSPEKPWGEDEFDFVFTERMSPRQGTEKSMEDVIFGSVPKTPDFKRTTSGESKKSKAIESQQAAKKEKTKLEKPTETMAIVGKENDMLQKQENQDGSSSLQQPSSATSKSAIKTDEQSISNSKGLISDNTSVSKTVKPDIEDEIDHVKKTENSTGTDSAQTSTYSDKSSFVQTKLETIPFLDEATPSVPPPAPPASQLGMLGSPPASTTLQGQTWRNLSDVGLLPALGAVQKLNSNKRQLSKEKKDNIEPFVARKDERRNNFYTSPMDMELSSPEGDIIDRMNEEFWKQQQHQSGANKTEMEENKFSEVFVQSVVANEESSFEEPYEPESGLIIGEEYEEDLNSITDPKERRRREKQQQKEKTKVQELIDKLHRQARVEEEVKHVLKAYYKHRDISKEEYKSILRRAVPQVTNSSSAIDPERIRSLVKKYVAKIKGER